VRQGKIWGATTEFLRTPYLSAHHLSILRGGFCSQHSHSRKNNLFYIVSGELELTIWQNNCQDVTVLRAGQVSTVPPGVFHMFRALTDVECVEVYFVEIEEPDIHRRTTGGRA
jgi:mannose-6-phosphate isomerase-like protein (cupin superfamily)